MRILVLDRLVHSYSSLNNPKKLVYGYEQIYAEATDYQAQRHEPPGALYRRRRLHLPVATWRRSIPGSELDVIEIDPGVTRWRTTCLGFALGREVASFNEDARMYLAMAADEASYDLIMGDAFNDYSVPYHLTTQEFNERVHAWLAPDGLYMVNMIDGRAAKFLRAPTSARFVPDLPSRLRRPRRSAPGATPTRDLRAHRQRHAARSRPASIRGRRRRRRCCSTCC